MAAAHALLDIDQFDEAERRLSVSKNRSTSLSGLVSCRATESNRVGDKAMNAKGCGGLDGPGHSAAAA